MQERPRDKLGYTSARGCKISSKSINNNKQFICSLKWEERERGITMMNFNFTDLMTMAAFMNQVTSSVTVTDDEVRKTETFKNRKDQANKNNLIWTNTLNTIKSTKAGMTDKEAAETAKAMLTAVGITGEVTEADIIEEIKDAMIAERKVEAQTEAMSDLGENMAQLKVMNNMMNSMFENNVVSTPAPAPAPSAPAESRMTMAERKQVIRDMVGSGTGTNQFRRHCSTTSMANEARAKIEQWRSLGYITGGQKAELRAEVNAAAWLGHCGVTATR